MATDFLQKYPTPSSIDLLQSENDKKNFVLAFRDIIRKHAEVQIYEDYSEDAEDLGMTEQQFNDYKSKYLDITVGFIDPPATPSTVAEDPAPYGIIKGWKTLISVLNFCIVTLSMWRIFLNSLRNLTHIAMIIQKSASISLIQ